MLSGELVTVTGKSIRLVLAAMAFESPGDDPDPSLLPRTEDILTTEGDTEVLLVFEKEEKDGEKEIPDSAMLPPDSAKLPA